jgi:hypothetical protein
MNGETMRVFALEEHYADPESLAAIGFDICRLPASRRGSRT